MKKRDIEEVLDSICPLITDNLKELKELTLKLSPIEGYELNEETQVKQQMRKQLCRVPRLYLP